MQPNPEKIEGSNYNEFQGAQILPQGNIEATTWRQYTEEQRNIITTGIGRVNDKINELLGNNNELTKRGLTLPKIRFVATHPDRPNWAGYFSPTDNEIVIIQDKIEGDRLSQAKVLIHEYLHFLSHNGRDDNEQISADSPIAKNNNVGFRRNFGSDIRKGKEGVQTSDYFLSFNEAVTEQLAIDVLPGYHETYENYRGLLNQVVDDAVAVKLGLKDNSGVHNAWSREEVKNYIYMCFFRGDLDSFTRFLKEIYKKYGISEQQFGLMTHRDDLPSIIEKKLEEGDPDGRTPPPSQVAMRVQQLLDSKTPDDYITDIEDSMQAGEDDASRRYAAEYDAFIEENGISPTDSMEPVGDTQYNVDNQGLIIYTGAGAQAVFAYLSSLLDSLLVGARRGEIEIAQVNRQIDEQLFNTYRVSMLSDEFKAFYIQKHTKIDNVRSK
jgi:hypothetical protein